MTIFGKQSCRICDGHLKEEINTLLLNKQSTYLDVINQCKRKGFVISKKLLNTHCNICLKNMALLSKQSNNICLYIGTDIENIERVEATHTITLTASQIEKLNDLVLILAKRDQGLTNKERIEKLLCDAERMFDDVKYDNNVESKDKLSMMKMVKEIIETSAKLSGELSDPLSSPQVVNMMNIFNSIVTKCPTCSPLVFEQLKSLTSGT